MAPDPKYVLTEQAGEDFDQIGLYSLDRWGLGQAERYLTDLDHCFAQLAKEPWRGKDRSDIRPGVWSYPKGKHMIFFRRETNGTVIVLRILGQSMDFPRHI